MNNVIGITHASLKILSNVLEIVSAYYFLLASLVDILKKKYWLKFTWLIIIVYRPETID